MNVVNLEAVRANQEREQQIADCESKLKELTQKCDADLAILMERLWLARLDPLTINIFLRLGQVAGTLQDIGEAEQLLKQLKRGDTHDKT